jgi:uncharacterized protein involved in type VI secretion and phage assembly
VQIPRIDPEVLVESGGGHRPSLITGRVYNKQHEHNVRPPRQQDAVGVEVTDAGRRGRELQRDPLRGQEGLGTRLCAGGGEDLEILVKNDGTRNVEHDRITTITNDDTLTVSDGNKVIKVETESGRPRSSRTSR